MACGRAGASTERGSAPAAVRPTVRAPHRHLERRATCTSALPTAGTTSTKSVTARTATGVVAADYQAIALRAAEGYARGEENHHAKLSLLQRRSANFRGPMGGMR